jgi:hypothetical protein
MDKIRISKSGIGVPTGDTALFIGEIYINEIDGSLYRAYSTNMGEWHKVLDDSISSITNEPTGFYSSSNDFLENVIFKVLFWYRKISKKYFDLIIWPKISFVRKCLNNHSKKSMIVITLIFDQNKKINYFLLLNLNRITKK